MESPSGVAVFYIRAKDDKDASEEKMSSDWNSKGKWSDWDGWRSVVPQAEEILAAFLLLSKSVNICQVFLGRLKIISWQVICQYNTTSPISLVSRIDYDIT